jgi:hypothetical protein
VAPTAASWADSAGDTAAEAAHHQRELHRAAAYLKTEIPGLEVQGYFVDFEGIWDAEVGTIEIGRAVVSR